MYIREYAKTFIFCINLIYENFRDLVLQNSN